MPKKTNKQNSISTNSEVEHVRSNDAIITTTKTNTDETAEDANQEIAPEANAKLTSESLSESLPESLSESNSESSSGSDSDSADDKSTAMDGDEDAEAPSSSKNGPINELNGQASASNAETDSLKSASSSSSDSQSGSESDPSGSSGSDSAQAEAMDSVSRHDQTEDSSSLTGYVPIEDDEFYLMDESATKSEVRESSEESESNNEVIADVGGLLDKAILESDGHDISNFPTQSKGSSKSNAGNKRAKKKGVTRTKTIQSSTNDLSLSVSDNSEHLDADEGEILIVLERAIPMEEKFFRKRKAADLESDQEKKRTVVDAKENNMFESDEGDPSVLPESPEQIFESSQNLDLAPETAQRSSSPEISVTPPELVEPVIIDIASESEAEELQVICTPSKKRVRSPFSLLFNPVLAEDVGLKANVDTVTLHELIGVRDLQQTFQFNFNVDVPFFTSFLHEDFLAKKKKVTFITGGSVLAGLPLRPPNFTELIPFLPHRYASHHSKMMVNFYEDKTVEVVIMSANLTAIDYSGLTQGIWRSGRLKKHLTKTSHGKRFRRDLCNYLKKYGLSVIRDLADQLHDCDFSDVTVELVASVPGSFTYESSKSETYGYHKLRQVLARNKLLVKDTLLKHNILAQVSSIASPYNYSTKAGKTASLLSHILCPSVFEDYDGPLEQGADAAIASQRERNYEPHLIFPTAREIAHSSLGFLSGTAVHFSYKDSPASRLQYSQNLKPYFCKWHSLENITYRENTTPHIKVYACDNGDDWKSLKWILMGSHNLSKQAWGYPSLKAPSTAIVSSYELSVLASGGKQGLIPVYDSDYARKKSQHPVRLPFKLPPEPYGPKDKPWSPAIDWGSLTDRFHNQHHGNS